MQKRQQVNLAQLMEMIENDIIKNKQLMQSVEDQIRDIDGNYQTFKTSNKVMDSNMGKLELTLKELSREENALQLEMDTNMASMEQKVKEQNNLVQQKV